MALDEVLPVGAARKTGVIFRDENNSSFHEQFLLTPVGQVEKSYGVFDFQTINQIKCTFPLQFLQGEFVSQVKGADNGSSILSMIESTRVHKLEQRAESLGISVDYQTSKDIFEAFIQ